MMQRWRLFLCGVILMLAGCYGPREIERRDDANLPNQSSTRPAFATPKVPDGVLPADPLLSPPGRAAPGDVDADGFDESEPAPRVAVLTGARTFVRPIADPRWPSFSAGLRWQNNARVLDVYEQVSLGDTIAFSRGPVDLFGREFELEFAIQGAVFATFDPNFEQSLINVDFVPGIYAALRRGRASGLLRLWHFSAHIGDEFLLEDRYNVDDRLPFSHEVVQILGSYDLPAGFRVYGGPSGIFNQSQENYGDLQIQAGLEWRSAERYFDLIRPVAAADLKSYDDVDFTPDLSVRAGVAFDTDPRGQGWHLMGEFYSGRDPNGEFYVDRVSYAGFGAWFQF